MRHFIAQMIFCIALVAQTASGAIGETDSSRAVDPFIEELEERTFRWFWETANPENGMVPDRAPDPPFCSIASVGFALTAYPVGIERGYITREQGLERVLLTLRSFWNLPQGNAAEGFSGHGGFFYHFLDMNTGLRAVRSELSTVDTGLLLMGVLFCQSYFDGPSPHEREVRALADSLYRRVDWTMFLREHAPLLTMSHRPERGFGRHAYRGYDEAMFLYLLAIASPTRPIPSSAWEAFTSSYVWDSFQGEEFVQFGPLFGHQYSHVWVDFRGIVDPFMKEKGIDYFENSARATRSQRSYAIENPLDRVAYGPDIWGLTACDGPKDTVLVIADDSVRFRTYWARGVGSNYHNDDGTIAPTAAGGSIPFAPDITLSALKTMRSRFGALVYNRYGFVDAFNPTFRAVDGKTRRGTIDPEHGWFDDQQLGIDQGPILLMIENYRSGMVWETMKRNAYIVDGLRRAGFEGGWLESSTN